MSIMTHQFTVAKALTTEQIGRDYFGERPHGDCGVGAVVSLTGQPEAEVFLRGLRGLEMVQHRGAESADGVSGDGAGILLEIPKEEIFEPYLKSQLKLDQLNGDLGVGQIFLPKENLYPQSHARGKEIVEEVLKEYGIKNYSWRKPPVNSKILGPIAAKTEPDTRQIVFECVDSLSTEDNEKRLYEAMLEIEKRIAVAGENDPHLAPFYICSLSSSTIVYKAMTKPKDLKNYWGDLADFERIGVKTRIVIFHQRFATNAAPDWRLAHPYRNIAHNGEVNTIKSTARDAAARTKAYVLPGQSAIQTSGSDTAQLDTIFHLLRVNGWTPIQALRQLVPPSLQPSQTPEFQAYTRYTQALSSQADGPAALVATNGVQFVATADRNSLRPVNCTTVDDKVLIVCSEAGAGLLPGDELKHVSRISLRGGEAVSVDLKTGVYKKPLDVEEELAGQGAYTTWVENLEAFNPTRREKYLKTDIERGDNLPSELIAQLKAVGFAEEDRNDVVSTLAETGKEVLYSMGSTLLAALSNNPAVHTRFTNFFRQNFAQVTNPPIDSEREASSFDMLTRLGDRGDLVSAHPSKLAENPFSLVELKTPILTTEEFTELKEVLGAHNWQLHTLDCTFAPKEWRDIESRVDALIAEAMDAVDNGATQLVVSHRGQGENKAIIPSVLMVAALDKALKERSLRHKVNIHSEAADVHDTHGLSENITSGADTVIPFLTEALIAEDYPSTSTEPEKTYDALKAYKTGMHKGLMKIMAKMGITTLNSYRGGHFHSAMGLDRAMLDKYFGSSDTIVSPISGMTLQGLGYSIARNHKTSYDARDYAALLHPLGWRSEADGALDLHTQTVLRLLEHAVNPARGGPKEFLAYAKAANRERTEKVVQPDGTEKETRTPILIRDLFGLKDNENPLSLDEVQSVESIVSNHFAIAAMSYGALSKEAIVALNSAAAELNMEVNSGEGGQDSEIPYGATTMQVASGRFGVTIAYLNSANKSGRPRIQIKIAQGAKAGEGGQLKAEKVTPEIAAVRNSTPGVELISPPPHHDIYSIEDLAQLIRDLRAANPLALISVKLVSDLGVGEIAAGVAKCGADEVHISGYDGGTGAAQRTSIEHTGWPAELGVTNTQQNLVSKGLRSPFADKEFTNQPAISTDGSIRTGRDVIIMAILGADKVSIGTAALQAAGCLMVRKCQNGTCPVGIATQRQEYRDFFRKDAEQRIRNFFLYLGQDTQRLLAKLGVKTLEELRGRSDLLVDRRLNNPEAYSDQVLNFDLTPILHVASLPENIQEIRASRAAQMASVSFNQAIENEFLSDILDENASGSKPVIIKKHVTNADLSIGAGLSGAIQRAQDDGKKTRRVRIITDGYAGQSLGVFASKEMSLEHTGDANDGVGKGLCGATLVVRKPANQNKKPSTIIGNAALYGATAGEAYFEGLAGDRFGVRNSGAEAVVMGGGDYFGEYMTKGFLVSLGPIGRGAFTGHSGGGIAVYDPKANNGNHGTTMVNNPVTGLPYDFVIEGGRQIKRLDGSTGTLGSDSKDVKRRRYIENTRRRIEKFYKKTENPIAKNILDNWQDEIGNFWVVVPPEPKREKKSRAKARPPEAAPTLVPA